MSNYVAGTATLVLGAQSDKLTRAFGEARKQVDDFGSSVGVSVAKFAALAAPVALVGAAFRSTFGEANRLKQLSDDTGIAAGAISNLEVVARNAGASSEGLGQAIVKTNAMIGKAIGGDEGAIKKFESLGLSIEQLATMSAYQRFQAVASAISGVGDQSLKTSAAMEIMGESSAKLLKSMDAIAKAGDEFTASNNRVTQSVQEWKTLFTSFWDVLSHTGRGIMMLGSWPLEKIRTATDYYTGRMAAVKASTDTARMSVESLVAVMDRQIEAKTASISKGLEKISGENQKRIAEREATIDKESNDRRAAAAERLNAKLAALRDERYRVITAKNDEELIEYKRYDDEIDQIDKDANAANMAGTLAHFDAKETATRLHQERIAAIKKAKAQKQTDDEIAKNEEAAADYQRYIESQDESQQYAMQQEERAKQAKKQAHSEEMAQLHGRAEMLGAYGQALGNITQITAEGANKSRAQFYTHKALMLAQAIVNTWTAYTAALTIPPPAGQILAGTIVAGGMYAASQIAGTQPAGRANGGAVSGGSAYEVGERGPELLTMNGRQYVIPGRDGYVNSGTPGGGSGPRITVNVINNGQPVSARVEQRGTAESMDIDVILSAVAGDIRGGQGVVSGAIESTYGANRKYGAR